MATTESELVTQDLTPNSRNGHSLDAYVSGLSIFQEYPAQGHLLANDLVGTGLTGVHVTEVNGQAIAQDGSYTQISHELYGELKVNMYGDYQYTANSGTAGHDETFVYKVSSSSGQTDYATLNVHTGLATEQVAQATTEYVYNLTSGAKVIVGGSSNDTLTGTAGNDYITGGIGNDTLHGGTGGRDYLDGGVGNDSLKVQDTTGDHRITDADFNGMHGGSGLDALLVQGSGINMTSPTLKATRYPASNA